MCGSSLMDPLDFLEQEQLLRFFHCKKTEMSCMEKPHTFLNQLRDHNLVPEERYKKVIRMKSKENMKNGLYGILDWLETERPQHIHVFWACVFQESIMNEYPILRLLRNSLMDGSFQFYIKLPERVEKEEKKEKKRKKPEEDKDGEGKQGKTGRKKKQKTKNVCSEEEQPGPSSQVTPGQKKKPQKPTYFSPLKKGEKDDIWTWPIYKTQIPVTCGEQKGMLNRDKLAKGMKCILVKDKKRWLTPSEFEKYGGKSSSKNWKWSIRCMDTPLGKLIKDGHLKSPGYNRGKTKAQKLLFPSNQLITVYEDEEANQDEEDQVSTTDGGSSTVFTDEETEEEGEAEQPSSDRRDSSSKQVFKVTCEDLAGTLHKHRFATGTCGKSIRTEECWMTPAEFVQRGSSQPDPSWKKDIEWEGKPLVVLLEAEDMEIHSMLCKCRLCRPNGEDLESQRNDDECFICRSEGEEDLVVCDHCPRSFHQKCHLPHVEEAILGDDRQWRCTFCVFRTNQLLYTDHMTYETVLSRQISGLLMECQYLLLSLCHADEEQIFATDPSLHVTGYTTLIKTPMWLDKIAERLQETRYQTVGEFVSDVRLIFSNCAAFNKNNEEFRTMGARLKEFFEREFKNVFRIQEND